MQNNKLTFDQAVLSGLHCNSMQFRQYQCLLNLGLGVPFPNFIISRLSKPSYLSRNVVESNHTRMNVTDEHYYKIYLAVQKYVTETKLKTYEIYDSLEERGLLSCKGGTRLIPYQRISIVVTSIRKSLGKSKVKSKSRIDREEVRCLRDEQGLTNREVAKRLGFTEAACSTAYRVYKRQLKLNQNSV